MKYREGQENVKEKKIKDYNNGTSNLLLFLIKVMLNGEVHTFSIFKYVNVLKKIER